jgi:hypothetical protein
MLYLFGSRIKCPTGFAGDKNLNVSYIWRPLKESPLYLMLGVLHITLHDPYT